MPGTSWPRPTQQRCRPLHELRSERHTTGTYCLTTTKLFERVRGNPANRRGVQPCAWAISSRILQELGNPSELARPFANFQSLILASWKQQGEDEAHYNLATVNRHQWQAHGAFDARQQAEALRTGRRRMPPNAHPAHKAELENPARS